MVDLDKPMVSTPDQPDEPDNREYEPTAKSMMWWGFGALAALAMMVGAIYDLGDGTRTTAPAAATAASSSAVPMGPNAPVPAR
jgi:hypothetical protein